LHLAIMEKFDLKDSMVKPMEISSKYDPESKVLPEDVRNYSVTAILSTCYLLISSTMVLYNKWMLSEYGFRFPLTLIIFVYLMNFLTYSFIRILDKSVDCLLPSLINSKDTVPMCYWFSKLLPLGIITGVEVAASVWGLLMIGVAFHTVVRASVPLFVLAFSNLAGLQPCRVSLVVVVALIAGGVGLVSYGEEVDTSAATGHTRQDEAVIQPAGSHLSEHTSTLLGLGLTLASSALAGLEWVLGETVLKGQHHMGTLSVLFYMTPGSILVLIPVFFVFEYHEFYIFVTKSDPDTVAEAFYFMIVASFLVFFLFVAEFAFVKHASSLTVAICHSVKELLLTIFGAAMFHEHVSFLDVVGFVIAMSGVLLYNIVVWNDQVRHRTESLIINDHRDEFSDDSLITSTNN